MVPYNILELEGEVKQGETQMASNLRAEFKERQHKGLFEALPALPSLAKKTRLEVSRDEPTIDAPMVQAPSFDAVRSGQELVPNPFIEDT